MPEIAEGAADDEPDGDETEENGVSEPETWDQPDSDGEDITTRDAASEEDMSSEEETTKASEEETAISGGE